MISIVSFIITWNAASDQFADSLGRSAADDYCADAKQQREGDDRKKVAPSHRLERIGRNHILHLLKKHGGQTLALLPIRLPGAHFSNVIARAGLDYVDNGQTDQDCDHACRQVVDERPAKHLSEPLRLPEPCHPGQEGGDDQRDRNHFEHLQEKIAEHLGEISDLAAGAATVSLEQRISHGIGRCELAQGWIDRTLRRLVARLRGIRPGFAEILTECIDRALCANHYSTRLEHLPIVSLLDQSIELDQCAVG